MFKEGGATENLGRGPSGTEGVKTSEFYVVAYLKKHWGSQAPTGRNGGPVLLNRNGESAGTSREKGARKILRREKKKNGSVEQLSLDDCGSGIKKQALGLKKTTNARGGGRHKAMLFKGWRSK